MSDIINDIRSSIVTLIESADSVQSVYGFEVNPKQGFPAVTVFWSDNDADFHSNMENRRTFGFRIRIYQPTLGEVTESAKERGERIVSKVSSELLDIFDKNYTLNNEVDFCKATPSKGGYINSDLGWMRTAEITIKAIKIISII